MSLLNEVQKFIEAHPGCTSGDIADAFAGYSRQRVLQSASKLRQSGRVAHRCEGDTRRHFPRLTERAQEPEPQPVRETKPVRNFYVGTNDPRVILCPQCQQQVLDMLISYQKERGFPPTNQEVATMLGYRSVNAAVEHLRALEKKGVITIKRGVARGITLHTAVKDDDSEAVGIIRALLAGEENARLRAAHWLHERGLKV